MKIGDRNSWTTQQLAASYPQLKGGKNFQSGNSSNM